MSFYRLSQQLPLSTTPLRVPRQVGHQQQQPLQQVNKSIQSPILRHQEETMQNSLQSVSQKTQQQEQMKEQQKDRLSVLHGRLQQEAEKIRKWKNSTELELKQKDQQLREAQQMIEKQRKSIIDAQLQNESLTTCVQDEVANQKEIQRKIISTREMCHALKEHVCTMEESVLHGENDRNNLAKKNQTILELYEELVGQFNQLEISQIENHTTFGIQIDKEKKHSEELSRLLEDLTNSSDQQIKTLQQQLVESQDEQHKLSCTLQEYTSLISSLTDQQSSLKKELLTRDDLLSSQQAELEMCHAKIKERKEEALNLQQRLVQQEQESHDLRKKCQQHEDTQLAINNEHRNVILEFKNNEQKLQSLLDTTKECLTEVQANLNHCEETKSSLIIQCGDLELKLKLSDEQITVMKSQFEDLTNKFDQLCQDHLRIQKELEMNRKQMTGIQQLLEQKEEEKEDIRQRLNQSLEEERQNLLLLKNELSNYSNQHKLLQKQNDECIAKLTTKETENASLEKEIESLKRESSITKSTLDSELLRWKEEVNDTSIEYEKLQSLLQELGSQIEVKNESIQNLDEKNQGLQTELLSRDQNISTLNSEMNTLKEQLTSLTEMKNQTEMFYGKEIQMYTSEISKLKDEVTCVCEEFKEEKKKSEDLKKMMDSQANEMGVTLERYKAENTQIVALKDKAIEALKEKEITEKEELQSKLMEMEEQKIACDSELENCMKQVKHLEQQLHDKEEELTQLITAASTLQSQVTSIKEPHSVKSTPICKIPQTPRASMATPSLKTPLRKSRHISPSKILSHVPSTPRNTRPRLCPRTPQSTCRLKQEKRQFQELFPDVTLEEDEAIFKKPQNKTSSPNKKTRQNKRVGQTKRGGKTGKKQDIESNLSWFDLDPVFGFPQED